MTRYNISFPEKQEVQRWVDKYVRDNQPLTLQQYKRIAGWLAGLTYREIAKAEGKSHQAVGASIKRDALRILAWAKEQNV